MFGQSRPVVLDRYGKRGSRWAMPRWLILLLIGIAMGAAGVIVVQERYLPPRLSASESTSLRASFEQADRERTRLRTELAATAQRLDAATADTKRLTTELSASRGNVDRLRETASALVASLPPDPRGGAVEVRAARFAIEGGALAYDVVLTRSGKPLNGAMQFVVTGASGRGADSSVTLKPIAISVGAFESLRGSVPLPEGFKPRETTISVLDAGGKLLGRRVIYVK
jgi:cell division protein FtsL